MWRSSIICLGSNKQFYVTKKKYFLQTSYYPTHSGYSGNNTFIARFLLGHNYQKVVTFSVYWNAFVSANGEPSQIPYDNVTINEEGCWIYNKKSFIALFDRICFLCFFFTLANAQSQVRKQYIYAEFNINENITYPLGWSVSQISGALLKHIHKNEIVNVHFALTNFQYAYAKSSFCGFLYQVNNAIKYTWTILFLKNTENANFSQKKKMMVFVNEGEVCDTTSNYARVKQSGYYYIQTDVKSDYGRCKNISLILNNNNCLKMPNKMSSDGYFRTKRPSAVIILNV